MIELQLHADSRPAAFYNLGRGS